MGTTKMTKRILVSGWRLMGVAVATVMLACQAAAPTRERGDGNPGDGGAGNSNPLSAGGATISAQLTLSEVSARTVGRYGTDVALELSGEAPRDALLSVQVLLEDEDQNPVEFFDSDFDGAADSSEGYVLPAAWPNTDSFTLQVLVPEAGELEALSLLGVSLVGKDRRQSKQLTAELSRQAVVQKNGSCDPELVTNRCAEGFACSGEPPTCREGTPPTLERAAYLRQADGPIMVAQGTDPDDDVILMLMEFLDSSSNPRLIDIDGDGEVDSDRFEAQQEFTAQSGAFSFYNHAAEGFEDGVPKVALTAIDSRGQQSERVSVSIATPSPRGVGQSCDTLGFAPCTTGNVCVEGSTKGSGTCTSTATGRANACAKAPTLDPENGSTLATGWLRGKGFWTGPEGCLPDIARPSPDAAVIVHLEQSASKVVLSTAEPETDLDTGLFVFSACDAPDAEALACGDDGTGFAAELTLTDLAAGDYVVVVKAIQPSGGTFGLSVAVQ